MRVLRTIQLSRDVVATVVVPDFIAKARTLAPLEGAAVRTTSGDVVGRVVEVAHHGTIPRTITIAWRAAKLAKAADSAQLMLTSAGLVVRDRPMSTATDLDRQLRDVAARGGSVVLH